MNVPTVGIEVRVHGGGAWSGDKAALPCVLVTLCTAWVACLPSLYGCTAMCVGNTMYSLGGLSSQSLWLHYHVCGSTMYSLGGLSSQSLWLHCHVCW